MNIKYLTLLLLISVTLSGCDKQVPAVSCSSADTQNLMVSALAEQTVKLTTERRYDQYDGSFTLGANNIRAAVAQIQIDIENVKTVKQEPDSSKSICTGQLKVTIPAAMLANANQARNAQHETTIFEYAKQFNIENDSNVFTENVQYSVKPTGPGKEPHVEFESAAWAHLFDEVITAVLLKTSLGMQETFSIEHNEPPKQDAQRLKAETEQLDNEVDDTITLQQKQGLERLNRELLEAKQAEQEILNEKRTRQSLAPVTATTQISPGFNCAKATKATELTICANAELAALDVENLKVYKDAKDIDAVATREIWKASIKSKYACGSNVACIKNVYKKSILDYGCISSDSDSDCGVNNAPQESESSSVLQ